MKEIIDGKLKPKILVAGSPALHKISTPVPKEMFGSSELSDFIAFMIKAMLDEPGVGLAAPQVGVNQRMFVYGVKKDIRMKDGLYIPNTAVINPSITPLSQEIEEGYEGCLSVGEIRAKVPRSKDILLRGFDMNGNKFEREASGFEARIIQHEYDHLDGILFLERVTDKKSFIMKSELERQSRE